MAYAYHQSNYAAGDYGMTVNYPYAAGGLFGFIGKAVGTVAKTVGGLVPGPAGAVARAVGGALAPSRPSAPSIALPAMPPPSFPSVPAGTPGASPVPGLSGMVQRALPGGASGYQGGAGGAPPGYHWNKSHSYAKNLPPGSFLVRNRTTNSANPRALRRAIRRQSGFLALARRVLRGSGYSIKRSGLGVKRRATRRR